MTLRGQSILIVEDELLIAMDIADTIAAAGGDLAGMAVSNRQAREILAKGGVTAAVLDVHIRDGEATSIAAELLACGIPFVIYTGSPLPHRLRQVFGGVPTITKPVPAEIVVQAIEDSISGVGRLAA